jgi:hypothetical protein
MDEISVHDNVVMGYSVDSSNKEILIRTAYDSSNLPIENRCITFSGVEGYLFLDNLQGIIFDIKEANPEDVYENYRGYFEKGQRYGWPSTWNKSLRGVIDFVSSNNLVDSSFGFDGFVVAKKMVMEKE